MANTSDGGKGDPPDPPNANTNNDTLSTSTPAAHSAKNDSVPTKIDRVWTNYSTTSPPAHSAHSDSPNRSPIVINNATPHPDSTDNALSPYNPTAHSVKNDSVLTTFDWVSTNYSTTSPPARFAHSDSSNWSPILNNNATSPPDSTDDALSTDTPATHSAKNDSVSTKIGRVLTNYSNTRPQAPFDRSERPDRSPILNNTAPFPPDINSATLSNSPSAAHWVNNKPVSPDIYADIYFFDPGQHEINPRHSSSPLPLGPALPHPYAILSKKTWTPPPESPSQLHAAPKTINFRPTPANFSTKNWTEMYQPADDITR